MTTQVTGDLARMGHVGLQGLGVSFGLGGLPTYIPLPDGMRDTPPVIDLMAGLPEAQPDVVFASIDSALGSFPVIDLVSLSTIQPSVLSVVVETEELMKPLLEITVEKAETQPCIILTTVEAVVVQPCVEGVTIPISKQPPPITVGAEDTTNDC